MEPVHTVTQIAGSLSTKKQQQWTMKHKRNLAYVLDVDKRTGSKWWSRKIDKIFFIDHVLQ